MRVLRASEFGVWGLGVLGVKGFRVLGFGLRV